MCLRARDDITYTRTHACTCTHSPKGEAPESLGWGARLPLGPPCTCSLHSTTPTTPQPLPPTPPTGPAPTPSLSCLPGPLPQAAPLSLRGSAVLSVYTAHRVSKTSLPSGSFFNLLLLTKSHYRTQGAGIIYSKTYLLHLHHEQVRVCA